MDACQEKIAGEYPLVAVVDNDESVRESLPDLLWEFGFATHSFSSAEEFLTSDSLVQTGCLILDIAMPGMTGFDLHNGIEANTLGRKFNRQGSCSGLQACLG
jgi:FixJ family two-component response regulator